MLREKFRYDGLPSTPVCEIFLPTNSYFHKSKTGARIMYSVGHHIKTLILPVQVHWNHITLTPPEAAILAAQHEFDLAGYTGGAVTKIETPIKEAA